MMPKNFPCFQQREVWPRGVLNFAKGSMGLASPLPCLCQQSQDSRGARDGATRQLSPLAGSAFA